MTISIEDAQALTNLRAIEAQKTAELITLQQTSATGIEATVEDQIAAKDLAIANLGKNPDKLDNDAWDAAMDALQAGRITLVDQNRAIQERNAIRQGDCLSAGIAKQTELTTAQTATTTFLEGLETGTADAATPAIEDRIAAIEESILQIAGV